MRQAITALVLAGAFCLSSAGLPVRAADDPSYLWVGAGTWETLRDQYRTGEFDIAYRSDYKLWIFKPQIGFLAAGDGDIYGYAGLYTDIYWSQHIVTTLSAAIGGFGGHGFDLGSQFEFRTGGDLAWRFDDASRLGVGFYHVSNAGITARNGGSESLLLAYSLPLGYMSDH